MKETVDSVEFVLMRGGTSKGVFLRAADVPGDREALATLLLDLLGSPDRRQIDGLGGADKLTSKAAIMGPPINNETDVTYLFAQVGIATRHVEFNVNCGNLTSAAAVYAIQEGYVKPVEGSTKVRIHTLNSNRIVEADVPTSGGTTRVSGDLAIAGVPGRGAPISLDFKNAAGAITGSLLPFGTPTTRLDVPGLGEIEVSVLDCANLAVFVDAATLGMQGTEGPLEIDNNVALVARINAIRQAVADKAGLGAKFVPESANPFCLIVSKPASYKSFSTGEAVDAASMDMVVRSYAAASVSRALAVTISSCTGVASRVPGTIPYRLLSAHAHEASSVRLGHPSGVIPVESAVSFLNGNYKVEGAKILRTARRIAEGKVFLHPVQAPESVQTVPEMTTAD